MNVRSSNFTHGGDLPQSMVFNGMGHSGKNRSPHLEWTDVPEGARSFAIVMHDPDAPTSGGFYHWVLFNIPGHVRELREGHAEGTAGHTDYGSNEYGGAGPPPGPPHRYNITVYALDVDKLPLDKSATGALVEFAIKEHTLAQATISGRYGT